MTAAAGTAKNNGTAAAAPLQHRSQDMAKTLNVRSETAGPAIGIIMPKKLARITDVARQGNYLDGVRP
jgi:prolyl-tRNA editing enzyme YbaK/EbsC (Cys-tRNA(Pro) deacylase)